MINSMLARALSLAVILLSLLSALNFLPKISFIQEITAAFWVYFLLFHLLSFPLMLCCFKSKKAKLIIGISSLWAIFAYGTEVATLYVPPGQIEAFNRTDFSLLYLNIYNRNQSPDAYENYLVMKKPQIVVLIEGDTALVQQIPTLRNYPYRVGVFDRGPWSMSLFSQYPFDEHPTTSLGQDVMPVIKGKLLLHQSKLCFALVHLIPPVSDQALYINKLVVRRLATEVRHSHDAWMILGDFNSTPFGKSYGSMIEAARVENALKGFGFMKTWPTWLPFVGFQIDHVFVKNGLQVASVERTPNLGSDHFGYFMTATMQTK